MKVLHVYRTYLPDTVGGIERVIHSIAVGTARLGQETTVLSLGERTVSSQTIDGHRSVKARRDFEIASTGFSREFVGLLKREAAGHDIINYHFPWPFMDLGHFMAKVEQPYVVTYHSDIVRQRMLLKLYRPMMKRFLVRAERIVATSANYVATSDVLSAFSDKVEVIPPGIDDVAAGAVLPELTSRWRSRFPGRLFVFTGMLRYYKGLEYLVAAARDVDADIAIVGAGPDEARLKAAVRSLDIKNVHFLGRLDDPDKYALLSIGNAFVFPSHLRSEAYGMSLVEAAMMGKPMITCEIGTGTTFINIHGETGLVVPPRDPEALAGAMNRLLERPDEALRFGSAARRRFEERFETDRMARDYLALYEKVGGR